jgi:hypothetical protein
VDVDDERAKEAIEIAERTLQKLGRIARRYDPPLPPTAGYEQSFWHLEGTSPFLLVDFAAVRHSSPDKFLEPEIHGNVIFHFNKGGAVSVPHVDPMILEEKLRARCARLLDRAATFWIFFDKQIGRMNWIEAHELYQRTMLGSLVEVLRVRYGPARHGFGTYYIRYDLPGPVAERLEHLFFVKDREDLRAKRVIVEKWFYEEVKAVEAGGIGPL